MIKKEVTRDDPAGLLNGVSNLQQGTLEWSQVSIGEQGQLYALSTDNQIYYRKGRSDSNLQGNMWELVDEYTFKQMDCGNNELYAITMFNEVYRRVGLSWTDENENNLVGDHWAEVKGWFQYVSTAETNIVWGIDVEYDVLFLE